MQRKEGNADNTGIATFKKLHFYKCEVTPTWDDLIDRMLCNCNARKATQTTQGSPSQNLHSSYKSLIIGKANALHTVVIAIQDCGEMTPMMS